MATKHASQKVLELAGTFVAGQKGSWNHADWEAFAEKVAALGYESTDEFKRNLGNVLEGAKYFFAHAPAAKAAPKRKAAPKKKPAAQ